MPTNNDTELRSEEVQDILTKMPHQLIRWGNTIILFIIFLVFIFSYFIKYPEIITGNITITTEVPPEKLIAKTSGKIQHLLVEDQSNIDKNTPLAIIENSANYKDVYLLKKVVDSIDINKDAIEFPISLFTSLELGDVGNSYSLFEKDFLTYQINDKFQPYNIDKASQNIESNEQLERINLLNEEKKIALIEVDYKKNELDRYKKLFEKGVISTQEWEQKNIEYLQSKKNITSLNSQISNLRSSLNNLGKEKKTTTLSEQKDILTLKRNLISSFNTLKKSISDWEINYVLKSSNAGQVSFLKIWSEQQNVNSGETIFVVVANDASDYIGKLEVLSFNSGKIKVGQNVNIRLANYPDREFGVIKGTVKSISLTPDKENNLLIDVSLPNGLKTSYNKDILFQQEMSGTADIVTEDLRLIERILYQFRDIFKR